MKMGDQDAYLTGNPQVNNQEGPHPPLEVLHLNDKILQK